jgi:hypothetical protein
MALRNPNDVTGRNGLGLWFYVAIPARSRKAIAIYWEALKIDPRCEYTLQNITQA